MTTEPLDRRRFLTDARDRLVNPMTGLRLRLEELLAAQAQGAGSGPALAEALQLLDRFDGEVDEVLRQLVERLPADPNTSLVDVIGEVVRRHGRVAGDHGRRLWIEMVDDVAVASDRDALLTLVERMVGDALLDHTAPVGLRSTVQGRTVSVQIGVAAPFVRSGPGALCSREIIGMLAGRCGGRWVPTAAGVAGVRVVLPLADDLRL